VPEVLGELGDRAAIGQEHRCEQMPQRVHTIDPVAILQPDVAERGLPHHLREQVTREASGRPWRPTDQANTVRLIEADAEVADSFGLAPGAMVYERARLVRDGDQPTHALTSYYLPEHVEGTPLVDPTPGPAGRGGGFAVLTLQGLEPDHMTETVFARMPTPDEVAMLELPSGEPVMILTRQTFTATDLLVEFARGIHAASRFAWTYTFKLPD
jgi:GntR family transcriptional regulator